MIQIARIFFYLSLLMYPQLIKAGTGTNKVYTMHISHFMPRHSHVNKKFLEPWAKKINQETNGRLIVKIHPGMSLGGSPTQLTQQARSGAVDAIWTVIGYTPGQFPKTEIFELPLISNSSKSVIFNMAINDYYNLYLKEEFKDFYVILLHAHAAGGFHLKNKVITITDLKKLKIRTPNQTVGKLLTKLDIAPIVMPVTDVYEGLNYGMLDGAMLPYEVVVPFNLYEKAKYHIDGPFYTTVFAFLMNKDFYNSLPKDIQKIVDNNSKLKIAYDTGVIFDDIDSNLKEKVKNQNNHIYHLQATEMNKIRIAADLVAKEWINKNSPQLYNDAINLLKKYEELYGK